MKHKRTVTLELDDKEIDALYQLVDMGSFASDIIALIMHEFLESTDIVESPAISETVTLASFEENDKEFLKGVGSCLPIMRKYMADYNEDNMK